MQQPEEEAQEELKQQLLDIYSCVGQLTLNLPISERGDCPVFGTLPGSDAAITSSLNCWMATSFLLTKQA